MPRHPPNRRARPVTTFGAVSCVAVILLGAGVAGRQDDANRGRQVFDDAGCATCHGPSAKGGTAPELVGTDRPYPDFLRVVREGIGEMEAQADGDVPDEQLSIIYEWLVQSSSNRIASDGATDTP
ncbi:MAG: cytochrome c [Vicinamibacterales bacterium]|nr:cytochrome c [Vicinamibacterales bacterium]MDP6608279.1 cytochrome c [Vicinamibacterales bacterium]